MMYLYFLFFKCGISFTMSILSCFRWFKQLHSILHTMFFWYLLIIFFCFLLYFYTKSINRFWECVCVYAVVTSECHKNIICQFLIVVKRLRGKKHLNSYNIFYRYVWLGDKILRHLNVCKDDGLLNVSNHTWSNLIICFK